MNRSFNEVSYAESPYGTLSEFMARSFGWMFAGLLVTFATAMVVASTSLCTVILSTGIYLALTVAELVLVVALSAMVNRLQPSTATLLFFVYAVLNGCVLSSYFVLFDLSTLVFAFLIGAVYFGVMAVYGLRTEKSLVGWGPRLLGGLVALLVVGAVGSLLGVLFGVRFGMMEVLLCAVSLLLFMGLTAYDTQMLKYYYVSFGNDEAMLHKAGILGALQLYLDFINIFLQIVRLLARSRNND